MSGEHLTEDERDLYEALGEALGIALVRVPVEEVERLRSDAAGTDALLEQIDRERQEAATVRCPSCGWKGEPGTLVVEWL